jgi:asparagine synthase (glutamine-hydrolysing)
VSGIVAAHGPFDPDLGPRMLERLVHRGPDGEGSRRVGDSWLGHRRLAIVDLEHGGQPLGNGAGDLWLVGDGGLYNHSRLRTELGDERFHSRSDHEVALHLFDDEGVDAFERLWGEFAFAIAADDGRFVATRDTLGVAPLYWARRDDTVLFASELKAFDEDWRGEVQPFPPGHTWTPQEGLRAWRPSPTAVPVLMRSLAPDANPPQWVFAAIRDSLIRAVERELVADVDVGVFLSGGVDSSIITAIAARAAERNGLKIKTFASGLSDSADLMAARAVASYAGTDHYERVYTAEEAIALVPEVISVLESFDPTLVHSSVPNHLVAELAREHVKAILVGEGADELFAGYSHYGGHDDAVALHEGLLETIAGLHIGGLQRVDRVTSANGLEARIPFLDLDVVEFALALPPAWKLTDEGRPAKWLLRRAFDGWIPDDVLWRKKEQFGQGTGMDEVLREHFGAKATDEELDSERDVVDPPLRTREELAYYRMFAERLRGIRAQDTVGRFVEA